MLYTTENHDKTHNSHSTSKTHMTHTTPKSHDRTFSSHSTSQSHTPDVTRTVTHNLPTHSNSFHTVSDPYHSHIAQPRAGPRDGPHVGLGGGSGAPAAGAEELAEDGVASMWEQLAQSALRLFPEAGEVAILMAKGQISEPSADAMMLRVIQRSPLLAVAQATGERPETAVSTAEVRDCSVRSANKPALERMLRAEGFDPTGGAPGDAVHGAAGSSPTEEERRGEGAQQARPQGAHGEGGCTGDSDRGLDDGGHQARHEGLEGEPQAAGTLLGSGRRTLGAWATAVRDRLLPRMWRSDPQYRRNGEYPGRRERGDAAGDPGGAPAASGHAAAAGRGPVSAAGEQAPSAAEHQPTPSRELDDEP